jgi:hypothetical protein
MAFSHGKVSIDFAMVFDGKIWVYDQSSQLEALRQKFSDSSQQG